MSKNNSEETPSNSAIARHIRRLSNKERLKQFLSLFKRDDAVLIVIVADPDSMASAFAVKRLLSRRVSEITIVHPNQIKRLNNIAMRDILKIPLQPLRGTKRDQYTKFVLLDSQPTHRKEFANINFDAVIDHHPL
ncbi:MAG: phosphoethanolamine methyltransferase, partial [Thermodesulfobacteria bacterium]|nr:phosphoethanolamine methyltransferase [Thermodesulfobacteriota bacterium]